MNTTKATFSAAVLALAVGLTGCSGTPTAEDTSTSTGTGTSTVKIEPGTTAQKNALRSAKNYLSFAAFSEQGLIGQLSSTAGDGYSVVDATWAVKHLEDVDWNEQAVKAGKNYLELGGFSRAGLIQQLSSSAGDKFTVVQATYAADKLGL